MPSVTVVGGGLAGLAATAALAEAGFRVDLHEARSLPGGRATTHRIPGSDGVVETIDNCQHILLRCCNNLLDLYRRLGVANLVDFHRVFYFIEPGGRVSEFKSGNLPHPAHFTGAFLKLRFLNAKEKLALVTGVLAMQRESRSRKDLDDITMAAWLAEKKQPQRVIDRFWRQVLVSAINEELDRMAASHGFQVFLTGFLGGNDSYEMGVPARSLSELYDEAVWHRWPDVHLHFRSVIKEFNGNSDYYIVTVPFEKVGAVLPGYSAPVMEHSPITGIHLWFDQSITDLPHATLLDRNIQWIFNKGAGRHVQLVVSASRQLTSMDRGEIIEMACRELAEFFPQAKVAKLIKAHVVKEIRATFSACPGLGCKRPEPETQHPNVFVAGDWTNTGWPATMEGAVRSGYRAAECVSAAAGKPLRFVLP